jgi:cell division transport system permease protein
MFILRETWRAIRNAPMTWAMSCVTLAVALAVTALFSGAAWKARTALRTARETLPIEAFFAANVSNEDASAVVDQQIKPLPSIRSVTFTSREEALSDYTRNSGEDVERILGLNPLPASATVRIADASSDAAGHIIERLRAIGGIADVRADLGLLRVLESRSHALDRLALIFGGLLLASSIFFLVTAARLTMLARRNTVHVMKQLGARRWQIVLPVALEGGLAGCFAGLLAWGLLLLLAKSASGITGTFMAAPQPEHYALLLAAMCGIGVLLGLLSSVPVAQWHSRPRP